MVSISASYLKGDFMATIHVMVGIPGSGKSTYAKKLSEEFGIKVISSDDVRDLNPKMEEKDIFGEVYRLISCEIKEGKDVILDATNSTKFIRSRIVERLKPYNITYDMVAYYFPIDYKTCYERIERRNQKRIDRYFPLDVLESYYKKAEAPSINEGFKEVKIIDQTPLGDVKEILLKNVVTRIDQGYAFFYSDERGEVRGQNGTRSKNSGAKIDFNTNFRLASVSKQFIAYGIYLLINSGKLSYDTKLNDIFYVGEYAKDITIKNLLNHTSGLLDYEDMEHTDEQIHDIDVLEYVKRQDKTYFTPGSKYQYSNTAFVILGLIIEKVSGRRLGDYMKEKVFLEASMKDTVVDYEKETIINNRAYGHLEIDGKILEKDQYWCSATIGDGGIYSNVSDLIEWLNYLIKMYDNGSEFFKANILPDGTNSEYALGIRHVTRRGVDIIYHCGETIGFNTIIGFVPSLNKKFIFLTNLGNHSCDQVLNNLVSIM